MKRLAIILIMLAICFTLGIYTTVSVTNTDSLQTEISTLLYQDEMPRQAQIFSLISECEHLINRLDPLINDNLATNVLNQTRLLQYNFVTGDENGVKKSLFLLSQALDNLADSESFSLHSLL